MVIRYSVEAVTLASDHPYWPSFEGFKIRDNKTDEFGFGLYTTLDAAQDMRDIMEQRIFKILGRN